MEVTGMGRDPREQVRDLIAAKLAEADRRAMFVPDGADRDALEYRHQADAVMELFPDVRELGEHHGAGLIVPVPSHLPGRMVVTHTRLMLSTAPRPVEREGRAAEPTGCPVRVWDGPFQYRCGLGAKSGVCATHGRFRPGEQAEDL